MPSRRFRPTANARKLIRPFPYADILRHIPSHMGLSFDAICLVNLILTQFEAHLLHDQDSTEKPFHQSGRRIHLLNARMINKNS